jgi:hypothetical protein
MDIIGAVVMVPVRIIANPTGETKDNTWIGKRMVIPLIVFEFICKFYPWILVREEVAIP